jgi:hypothetical protein
MTSWFEDVFRCGTPGFDVDLSRILPVAMMVAVDCRVGDCVATDTHAAKKEMYMKLKDIELTLGGDEEVVTKVVAMVIIRFEKGYKYVVPCFFIPY